MLPHTTTRMAATVKSSPFSRAVFSAMRKLYPEHLADKSFDNTGLLLEAPYNPASKLRSSVLLTIDLTTAVAQEAIDKKASVIVAYHPIIFRGIKQLNLANSQQISLLRLAAEGISVYSPHTAVDAATDGNADWMADIVTAEANRDNHSAANDNAEPPIDGSDPYRMYKFPKPVDKRSDIILKSCKHTRTVVHPNTVDSSMGMGRVVEFETPRPLAKILSVIARYFNNPRSISLARAYGKEIDQITISSIGICAGSGASVLSGVHNIDLIVTGEISHHEALAAVESGKSVIAFGHSDSERGYLSAVMKDKLRKALIEEWASFKAAQSGKTDDIPEFYESREIEVEVSTQDCDPFATLVYEPVDYT